MVILVSINSLSMVCVGGFSWKVSIRETVEKCPSYGEATSLSFRTAYSITGGANHSVHMDGAGIELGSEAASQDEPCVWPGGFLLTSPPPMTSTLSE